MRRALRKKSQNRSGTARPRRQKADQTCEVSDSPPVRSEPSTPPKLPLPAELWWSRAGTIAKCLTAAAAVFGSVMVVFQLGRVAETNRLQSRAIEASNRPWVWVKSVAVTELGPTGLTVRIVLTNTGHSPAKDLNINGPALVFRNSQRVSTVEDLLWLTRVDAYWRGETLGPGQDFTVLQTFRKPIRPEVLVDISAGRATLSLMQNIVYSDEFSERPRVSNQCWYFEPLSSTMLTCHETEEERRAREMIQEGSGSSR